MQVPSYVTTLPRDNLTADGSLILSEDFVRAAIENAPTVEEFDSETKRQLSMSASDIAIAYRKRSWGDFLGGLFGKQRSVGPVNRQP